MGVKWLNKKILVSSIRSMGLVPHKPLPSDHFQTETDTLNQTASFKSRDLRLKGRTISLVGAFVNILLIIIKFAAGIYGHSQALIADAVHSVSDLFTDIVVIIGIHMGGKPPDPEHHFGHAKLETLASAFVGFALMGTALFLGKESIINIYAGHVYHPTLLALSAAFVSIVSKETLYHYTRRAGKKMKSQALIANAWHHRSDALSSLAVLFGVAGARINPSWYFLDSFAALLVSFLIVKVGFKIVRNTWGEFTDKAPSADALKGMKTCALSVTGVLSVHDIRVRTSGGFYQMEIHIVVDGKLSVKEGHAIAKAVETCLTEEVAACEKVIVHVDPDETASGRE
jgi:cation diffusion facilitator family transporter